MNYEAKIQTVAIGKAARLYKLIKSKSKSAAITTAILLLARDERSREVFFSDLDEVDKILNDKNPDTNKPKQEEEWT